MRIFSSSPTPSAIPAPQDPAEVVLLLREFDLFGDIPDDQLEVLAGQLVVSTARPGQVLERQDVKVHNWKLIAAGHAYVAHDGAPIGLVGRGESWSEYSMLNQQRSSISVVALSPVTLLRLAERDFFAIPDHSPLLAGRLVARSATSADRMGQPVYRALVGLSQRGA
jgi:CRP-like cAMP-binding protein